jgi:hypothetical protein
MAKSEPDIISIDDKVLSYGGKIIPLRNIAYVEKHKLKKKSAGGPVVLLLLSGGALAAISAQRGPVPPPIIPILIVIVVVSFFSLIGVAISKQKWALVLQTTAGDVPRILSGDERSVTALQQEITKRMTGEITQPFIADLRTYNITGDHNVVGNEAPVSVGDLAR